MAPTQTFNVIQARSFIHMDSGANCHIFRKRVNFIVYAKLSAHIFQVSDTPSQYKEMGIVPIKFNNLDIIYVLYPCHHIPKSLQDTLGLAPLKRYNKVRSARLEALVWLRIIHKDSGSVQISTILIHHTS